MKKLYIIKAGTTFPATKKQFGDFDQWTVKTLGSVDMPIRVVDVENGITVPNVEECAGVIITGSHAMVTDRALWSVKLEKWVMLLLKEKIPVFGICYGHQLLACAEGGLVDFHPQGKEIGTVSIQLLPACSSDPIFKTVPNSFLSHVTHSQTVLNLPEGACMPGRKHA
jgi:GMP synthase (glutamine-hydrolysing)